MTRTGWAFLNAVAVCFILAKQFELDTNSSSLLTNLSPFEHDYDPTIDVYDMTSLHYNKRSSKYKLLT
jgi:hypothetical protein